MSQNDLGTRSATYLLPAIVCLSSGLLLSDFQANAEDELSQTVDPLRLAYQLPPEQWPAATIDEGVEVVELGLLPAVSHPEDNPDSEAKRELGELLFFDPRLSGSAQMACASCHDPDLGWADGRTVSFGHSRKTLQRNSPTIRNTGHVTPLFWDGRAPDLEDQAIQVIENVDEFRSDAQIVAERLNAVPAYREKFAEVFGDEQIDIDRVAKAIACFVRSVNSERSRFDLFMKGRYSALTDQEIRGLHLFRTKGRCLNCHHGPNFTDNKLHNTGLSLYGRRFEDLGQYNVTKNPEDVGKFKTPTLRDIENTSPYMHHGLFHDLDVTIMAYNGANPEPKQREDQMDDPLYPTKSPLIVKLGLTRDEVADLKAFLLTLTEPHRQRRAPELPEGPEAE